MLTLRRSSRAHVLGLLGILLLTFSRTQAATVTATFNAATDLPITAAGYTAAGDDLEITLGFAPPVGTHLTVIKNTARPFITGAFSNVPNGSTVNLTYDGVTYPFIAWYYGGSGNDLVLLWPTTGLAAWGYNYSGQLGIGGNGSMFGPPRPIEPAPVTQHDSLANKVIIQVATGSEHTLALTHEGRVYAWGANGSGELGNGSTTDAEHPEAVDTSEWLSALHGRFVVAVAAGARHSLALCSDGTAVIWGYGDTYPQWVDASSSSALFGKTVVAISAGFDHSLALCSDGTVVKWRYIGSPQAVAASGATNPLAGKQVISVAAGADHSLALCSDGSVAAWGRNSSGQLGDGSTITRSGPVAVQALSGQQVVAIAAGESHSLALCADGVMLAWGLNDLGQLGNSSVPIISKTPVSVWSDEDTALYGKFVVSIAAGAKSSLARCSDGSFAVWGAVDEDELFGSSTAFALPTALPLSGTVLSGKTVHAVSSGPTARHYFALYSSPVPSATTLAVNDLSYNVALLDASITPGSLVAQTSFEFGTSTAYGTLLEAETYAPGDIAHQPARAFATSLSSDTEYHFRVVIKIGASTIYGEDQTFRTLPSPFMNWQWSHFGTNATNPVIAGPTADADGDCLPNLLEYATRTNPNDPNASALSPPVPVTLVPSGTSGQKISFPYRSSTYDVRYILQRSPDLATWTDIFAHNGSTEPQANVSATVDSSLELITVIDSSPGSHFFWRLIVEPRQ